MKRGFILIESSIALVIISCALFTFMLMFIVVVRAAQKAAGLAAATQLSSALMEEIRLRTWGDGAGETASGKKTSFKHVGAFNGWREAPPVGPMMENLSGFGSYTRSAEVYYVDSGLTRSLVATDYMRVRVCTSSKGMTPVCLDTLMTNR